MIELLKKGSQSLVSPLLIYIQKKPQCLIDPTEVQVYPWVTQPKRSLTGLKPPRLPCTATGSAVSSAAVDEPQYLPESDYRVLDIVATWMPSKSHRWWLYAFLPPLVPVLGETSPQIQRVATPNDSGVPHYDCSLPRWTHPNPWRRIVQCRLLFLLD